MGHLMWFCAREMGRDSWTPVTRITDIRETQALPLVRVKAKKQPPAPPRRRKKLPLPWRKKKAPPEHRATAALPLLKRDQSHLEVRSKRARRAGWLVLTAVVAGFSAAAIGTYRTPAQAASTVSVPVFVGGQNVGAIDVAPEDLDGAGLEGAGLDGAVLRIRVVQSKNGPITVLEAHPRDDDQIDIK